jgi:Kdo2-lipid IVA lauroyltransferase/acyltransferase
MEKLALPVIRFFIFLFGLVPFWVIYGFSDFLFILLYYFIRYRKKLVFKNLRNSFPEKSEAEIKKIAKRFFHHFIDVFLESLKSFTMPEKAIRDRYRFINAELVDSYYDKGRPVVCITGHFNNWEWGGVAAESQMKHRPIGFYKPLSNKELNDYVLQRRANGRVILASITKTAETFQVYRDEPVAFYMVSDQRPSSTRFAYWTKFLNQDTPVLLGPEKYARIYNYPVIYVNVQKIRRGHYQVEFILIEENPANSIHGEITRKFMEILEEKVKEHPQYYLWTHNRWKFKRPLKTHK